MKVLIQFNESYQDTLEDLGLDYTYGDGVLDVIVDDVDYKYVGSSYLEPNQQLCEHYGFNHDYVDNIEAL